MQVRGSQHGHLNFQHTPAHPIQLPAPRALQGVPLGASWQAAEPQSGSAQATGSGPASSTSTLTAEQRARMERNRQEALRRQAARRQALQTPTAPTIDGKPSLPAVPVGSVHHDASLLPTPTSTLHSHQQQQHRQGYMQPAPQLQQQQQQAWPGNTGPQHLQPTQPPTQPPQHFWPQLAPSSHTTQQQHGALQQRSTSGQIYTHNQQHPQQEAWGGSGRQALSSSRGFLGAAPAWSSATTHSAGPAPLAPATTPLPRYLGGRSGRSRGFNFRPPPGLVSSGSTRIGSGSAGADASAASRLDSTAPHNLPQVSAAPPQMQPGSLAAAQSLHQQPASASLAPQVLPLQPPFQHPPPAGPALSGGFMGAGDAWPGLASQPAVALTSAGQPARKPAAAAHMPKSLKRGRAEAAANVSYSFDPNPLPQKPMAQTTLQQALRRHTTRTAATADRQQQPSAEQQSTQQFQRQQDSLPDISGGSSALASARTGRPLAELPWPPLQHQRVVHNTLDGAQQEQAGPWPAAAAVSLVHSPIERCTGTNAAPQPCEQRVVPSGRGVQNMAPVHDAAPHSRRWAAPATASRPARNVAAATLTPTTVQPAFTRLPLSSSAGRKAPLAAGAGAGLSCNPVDAADRRQKLRYLLAADANPFLHSAASNGRCVLRFDSPTTDAMRRHAFAHHHLKHTQWFLHLRLSVCTADAALSMPGSPASSLFHSVPTRYASPCPCQALGVAQGAL